MPNNMDEEINTANIVSIPSPELNIIIATIQDSTISIAPITLHALRILNMPQTHEVIEQTINNIETISNPSQPKPAGISKI